MPINRLQCPSCGAPLVPGGDDSFSCDYCGMRLKANEGSAAESVATPGGTTEDDPLLARRMALMRLIEQHNADLAEYERLRRKWIGPEKGDTEGDPGWLQRSASLLMVAGLLLALYAFAHAEEVSAGHMIVSALAFAPLVVFLVVLARASGKDTPRRPLGRRRAPDRIRQRLDELEVTLAQRRERIAALEAEIDQATNEL